MVPPHFFATIYVLLFLLLTGMALFLFRNFISPFSNSERFKSFNVSGLAERTELSLMIEDPVLLVAKLEVRVLTFIRSDLSFQNVPLCTQFLFITFNAYSCRLQCLLSQLAQPCLPRQQKKQVFFSSLVQILGRGPIVASPPQNFSVPPSFGRGRVALPPPFLLF